ncbi:hypothetical protein ACX27_00715 [Nostoc piscinale CENA21]|uniref:Uncharacterized protein n=1 Tax=Nostoc piscinale CENA21 TaxID=224013 RepID=A0A0M4THA8_9NOSO|nr:hypothetical protein ACX27_00715 [Nostoc piscinale CENA21]
MILSLIVTLISLGAGIMGLSILKTRKILRFFKTESDKLSWRIMFSLMVFFSGWLFIMYLLNN